MDLDSGQPRGKIKVSAEPEGVGVNPVNGEVYVTCEDKGEVFAISTGEQRVIAKIDVGACHIDLESQHMSAIGEFARAHPAKEG